MTSRNQSATATSLVALSLAMLVACAARRSEPPPEPPPPRALQITAQRRQSQARQDRDKADCQGVAGAQATSSETWSQIFAACMSGRGYRVDDAYAR